jgi:hypothetical protein
MQTVVYHQRNLVTYPLADQKPVQLVPERRHGVMWSIRFLMAINLAAAVIMF